MTSHSKPRPRAVLVGVQLPTVSDVEHEASLLELGRLVKTLGYEVAGTVSQRRDALSSGAVLGDGKLKELAEYTGGTGVVPGYAKETQSKARARFEAAAVGETANSDELDDFDDLDAGEPGEAPSAPEALSQAPARDGERPGLVVVDHEISPRQARNLERATGAEVLDRTGVIVEIFHRHAQSREARLQVEIARLKYVAPRMRESTGRKERQQGRGAGESALELDRRKIRDRIAELKEELDAIATQHDNRRQARQDHLRVALVGYTNAGKSSLMRALTESDVLIADKLFATLDTTVRALYPETKPRILMSDTVGFIKKLPHDLVASFRSTLDEALEASLLLYVMDASDPTCDEQLEVTRSVLAEIGADAVPHLLVLNKADRLDAETRVNLTQRYPAGFLMSAKDPNDIEALRQRVIAHFEAAMQEEQIVVPYSKQSALGEIYAQARVLSESYDEAGAKLQVRALPAAIARLRQVLGS
jgi:GTP-binding protein HflX